MGDCGGTQIGDLANCTVTESKIPQGEHGVSDFKRKRSSPPTRMSRVEDITNIPNGGGPVQHRRLLMWQRGKLGSRRLMFGWINGRNVRYQEHVRVGLFHPGHIILQPSAHPHGCHRQPGMYELQSFSLSPWLPLKSTAIVVTHHVQHPCPSC